MSATYVGLLRGINVGKAKRVAMADLRAAIESLGYGDVRTVLNSGNAVFTATRPLARGAAEALQQALLDRTGVSSRFFLRSAAVLEAIVAADPAGRRVTDPSRYFVGFLYEPATAKALTALAARSWAPELMAVGDGVVYLWCPSGLTESPAAEAIGRALGDAVTIRNWSTVQKIGEAVSRGS